MPWIDLRNELDALFDGDNKTIPQSRWIVLRIMRIGQYSKFWDPKTNEAIGGPKWNYDDFVIRTISRPGGSFAGRPSVTQFEDTSFLAGLDLANTHVYAIQFNPRFPRVPAVGDIVYEIDKYASVTQPKPPFKATDRMFVKYVHKISGDFGRSEAFLLFTERKQGDW